MTQGRAEATLLLIRHAETDDNVAARLSGWTDTELSERGEAQVRLVAGHVIRNHPAIGGIYASPLIRARRTAEAVGQLTGHPVQLDPDLREMHFGDLDGLCFDQIKDVYIGLIKADEDDTQQAFMWPNGESRDTFRTRIMAALDAIARRHLGNSALVVTHGGVIATFLTVVHQESTAHWRKWTVPNASLTELAWDPALHVGHLARHGEDGHLGDLASPRPGSRRNRQRATEPSAPSDDA